MLDHLKRVLDFHLLTLSSGVVTLASILIAVSILFSAALIGNVGGRGLRRMLNRRGLPQGTQFAASKIFGYAVLAVGTMVAFDSMGIRLDALIATSAVVAVGIGFGLQKVDLRQQHQRFAHIGAFLHAGGVAQASACSAAGIPCAGVKG